MAIRIREYLATDHDSVVELSLRAWSPVFASMESVLGDIVARALRGEDWRDHQAREVSEALRNSANHVWVAAEQDEVSGFVAARIADGERGLGEIYMLAVEPARQRNGIGRALTEHATGWLRSGGMSVAMIGTAGDAAHAPARRLYEQEGYRAFPSVAYYKSL